ncbi:MAG: endolytic transglycosylase MltG [Bacillota bacterium]
MMNGEKTGSKKTKTKKRKKVWLSLLMFLMIFILIFVISSFASYNIISGMEENADKYVMKTIDPADGIEVEIPFGANTETIAEVLKESGVISHPFIFKFQSKFNGYDGLYKSGKHIVSKDLSYDDIMRVLCSNPVTTTVTIPEGKNLSEIIKILSDKDIIDNDNFKKVVDTEKFEYRFLEQLPKRNNRLEGYLFPDTYFFDPKSGEKEIIKKFLNNFDAKFSPEFYQRAEELGMTVDEVIILASIIEKETKLPEERAIVSSVFHNRLKSRNASLKKLQSCATIQYILYNKEGKIKETISEADTRIEDPYNTYLHDGLPPGPICSPGLESIEAALYPDEESEYLYFVAKGDGSHEFSKTLAEHQSAVKKYSID